MDPGEQRGGGEGGFACCSLLGIGWTQEDRGGRRGACWESVHGLGQRGEDDCSSLLVILDMERQEGGGGRNARSSMLINGGQREGGERDACSSMLISGGKKVGRGMLALACAVICGTETG